jgi:DNA invertase Pin-like site-specific DNA recombinase
VTIIGYVRESSFEDPLLQEVALKVWGADIIRAEQRSSARTNPRKELRTILKTISAGDTLMVTRLDRLARDFADLQSIARTLRLKGATLRATEQPIDTGAAAGKTFLDYLNVFAEFDVNLRRERRLEGIVRARAEGRFAGRPATIDPVRIRKMRAQGIKPPVIAKALGICRATVYRALGASLAFVDAEPALEAVPGATEASRAPTA